MSAVDLLRRILCVISFVSRLLDLIHPCRVFQTYLPSSGRFFRPVICFSTSPTYPLECTSEAFRTDSLFWKCPGPKNGGEDCQRWDTGNNYMPRVSG